MNIMDKVLLLGDYFNGLADLSRQLSSKYEVERIAFLNTSDYPNLQIESNWSVIDCRDFHELTIRLMDFEPERIIYLSPFYRKSRCELYPDLAEMTNSELLEHLKEVLSIFAGHLILLIPDTSNKINHNSILENTINQGIDAIRNMGRLTVIKYNQILDSSPEGYNAWLNSMHINAVENKQPVVTIPVLSSQINEIINKSDYGDLTTNNINVDQLTISRHLSFTGNPKDFTWDK